MRQRLLVVISVFAVFASSAAVAADSGGLTQLTGSAGCIENAAGAKDPSCATGHALQEVSAVVVSPDGKNAYSISTTAPFGIESFRRDPATGGLTQLSGLDGCTTTDGTDETTTVNACRTGAGLAGARFVLISPDGANVYVASGDSHAIAIFNRDAATGALTQPSGTVGCLTDGSGTANAATCGTGARLLSDVRDTTISPDGRFIYASGADSSAVSVVARNTTTGALTPIAGPLGCINANGNDSSGAGTCTTARALYEPTSIAITPDGRSMYVTASEGATSSADGAVISFSRDPSSGAVTQLSGAAGCLNPSGNDGSGAGTCTTGRALHDANGVALSPDGTSVYVAAQGNGGVTTPGALDVFSRDTTTGALTQLAGTAGCISLNGTDGYMGTLPVCATGRGLDEVSGVTVSADGRNVYTGASDTDNTTTPPGAAAVAIFARDTTSGTLTQLAGSAGCISDATGTDSVGGTTCAAGRGVSGPNIIALSPDCTTVYVANQDDPAGITAFARGPACVAPVVTIGAVSAISTTTASVAGTVNAVNGAGTAHFEFGPTSAYGSSTATTSVPGDGTADPVSAAISGLAPATTYHVRLVAQNAFGTSASGDQTFTTAAVTPPPPPPPPPPARPVTKITRVRVSSTSVRVTIACHGPSNSTCTGSLALTIRIRVGKHHRLRTVTIGHANAKLAAGSSRTITIRIGARGRALRHQRTLRAKLTLTLPRSVNQRKVTTGVTLKRLRAKHHRR